VEVGVAQLRRELKEWLERARSGDEVIVTERGRPVARLTGLDVAPLLDRLTEEGLISAPLRTFRPRARDRQRVKAEGSVADLLVAERERRR
jgi:prevent-host-death family protein